MIYFVFLNCLRIVVSLAHLYIGELSRFMISLYVMNVARSSFLNTFDTATAKSLFSLGITICFPHIGHSAR